MHLHYPEGAGRKRGRTCGGAVNMQNNAEQIDGEAGALQIEVHSIVRLAAERSRVHS